MSLKLFDSIKDKLDNAVGELAQAHMNIDLVETDRDIAKAALEDTAEWYHYQATVVALKKKTEAKKAAYAEVRRLAYKERNRTNKKRVHPAVLVTDTTTYDYNVQKALDWAVSSKIVGALKLNIPGFKKIVKALMEANQVVECVTLGSEYGCRINTDLTAYLPLVEDDLPF